MTQLQSLRQQLIAEFVAEQEAMREEERRAANERAERLSKLLPGVLEPIFGSTEYSARRVVDCPTHYDAMAIVVGDIQLLARLIESPYADDMVSIALIVSYCPDCNAPLTADWLVSTRYELAALLAREQRCPSIFIRCPYCGSTAGE